MWLIETMVTQFSSSGEEEYPKGEVVAKPLVVKLLTEHICRYHPDRWPPLLPGGGEFSYHRRFIYVII